jgi:hypothetical protein
MLLVLGLSSCNKRFSFFNSDPSKLKIKNLDFEYLALRTKIKYKNDNKSQKATANIRIKKDSLIWFSITPGLGIEAARGLISKDSIIILDKIHKTYSILKFEDLSKQFHFDLDLNLIESVLVGNMIWPVASSDKVIREPGLYNITKKNGDLTISHLIGNNTMKLEKIYAISDTTQNSLDINYQDFNLIDNKAFPNSANIYIKYIAKKDNSEKFSNITLDHSKVEIDKKKLKFSLNIPSKYERK